MFSALREDVLRARYASLIKEVPVVVVTAMLALCIQMMVLQDTARWLFATALPLIKLVMGGAILVYWFSLRHQHPPLAVMQRRMHAAACLLMLAGMFGLIRSLYLFPLTDSTGQYFLMLHNVIYGFCFALMLSKLGPAAYVYNVLMIIGAISCMWRADRTALTLLSLLVITFEAGVLLTMRAGTRMFDQWVVANHETETLLQANQRLANEDALTLLPNRRLFFEQVAHQLAVAKQRGDCLAVGLIDLDNFKPVNDLHGHHVGDLVLVEVGKRLATLGADNAVFYRLGGDEFAFYLFTNDAHTQLQQTAAHIHHALSQPISLHGLVLSLSASLGASIACDESASAQSLYEHADFALYHVKRSGRGYLQIYTPALQQARDQLERLEHALRQAVIVDEMHAVFQPVIQLEQQNVSGIECLARWHSPSLGTVMPEQFIPLAESLGISASITAHLFDRALVAMRDWPPHVSLYFNCSASDISDASVVSALLARLAASGIAPDRCVFELTETAVLHDFDVIRAQLQRLKQAGAQIALDDFGTGYSSLSHVQSLPLDILRIDRRFIRDLPHDSTSQTIVRAILALCHGMHLQCIAEGAEDADQVCFLQAMGCEQVQGFYFAAAMPAADLRNYLSHPVITPASA